MRYSCADGFNGVQRYNSRENSLNLYLTQDHLSSKDDTAICLLFLHADIKLYQACNIGHISPCSRTYSGPQWVPPP